MNTWNEERNWTEWIDSAELRVRGCYDVYTCGLVYERGRFFSRNSV